MRRNVWTHVQPHHQVGQRPQEDDVMKKSSLALLFIVFLLGFGCSGNFSSGSTDSINELRALGVTVSEFDENKGPSIATLDASVSEEAVSGKAFELLHKLPSLNAVRISSKSMLSKEDVTNLSKIQRISLLELSNISIESEVAEAIGLIPIDSLLVSGCSSRQISKIVVASQLKTLAVKHCPDLTADQLIIPDNSKLNDISIINCDSIDNGIFRQISECRDLTRLYISGCKNIGKKGLGGVRQLQKIEKLALIGANFPDASAKEFIDLPRLTKLDISLNELGDECTGWIARCNSLHELDFSGNSLSDFGIQRLSECRSLKILAIEQIDLSSDDISNLIEGNHLDAISFDIGKAISIDEINSLKSKFPNCEITVMNGDMVLPNKSKGSGLIDESDR